ncbi:MAG: hypothetical protein HOV94_34390, partial [Saccharothrix sp.]|nr:hypothetical protein [Saccharothrix sp.]
ARFSLGRLALDLVRVLGDGALRCHLWQVVLAVPPGTGNGVLVRALRADGLGEGCLVLGGGVVAPPVGRVHCALRCAPTDLDVLKARVLTSFARIGAAVRGAVHAA